jgi:hypothetical protein
MSCVTLQVFTWPMGFIIVAKGKSGLLVLAGVGGLRSISVSRGSS